MTGWMSLHNWPLLGKAKFIGLENYQSILQDQQFWDSLKFTARYTLIVTPAIFILGFILAMLVKTSLPGVGFFRTAYFLPVVIGFGASSLLWVWMLNDRVGVFDGLLMALKVIKVPVVWLGELDMALAAIIVSVVWKWTGFTMILLLGGLQSIPDEIYQAAMVDGAGFWDRLVHITLPLMRRTLAMALVHSVIGSVLAFDQFYLMTRGGPQNQTITAVYWIYTNGFFKFRMGYASALSIVLLVILVILSAIQMRLLRDENSY
jgi:multiple sugar transport system permease protein